MNKIEISEVDSLVLSKCPSELMDVVGNAYQHLELKAIYYLSLFDLNKIDPSLSKSLFPEIYFCLIQSVADGSSCLSLNDEWCLDLIKKLRPDSKPAELIAKFIAAIKKGLLQKIIHFQNKDLCPFVLVQRGDKFYLYFEKNYLTESYLKNSLERFSQMTNVAVESSSEFNMNDILEGNPVCFEDGSAYQINDEQLASIEMAMQESFSIITGGPGTGKTFILFSLLRALVRSGYDIAEIVLAAPTGKATNRMMESVQQSLVAIKNANDLDNDLQHIKCMTIHRLLEIAPFRIDGAYHENHYLPYRFLIIDEASMIDMSLMNNILKSINPKRTKLLLIGDKDQLPSVELGAVLSDLIVNGAVDKISKLTKSYRSKAGLQKVIDGIKAYDGKNDFDLKQVEKTNSYLKLNEDGCALLNLENKNYDFFLHQLKQWIHHFYNSSIFRYQADECSDDFISSLLGDMTKHQVLAVVNNGPYGVDQLNEFFIQEIKQQFNVKSDKPYFRGMPIQILRNDYELNLFNGDFGVIIESQSHEYMASFLKNGKVKSFPVHLLPAYQPGFVTTIHKSQGSEYEKLLLIIPPEKSLSILNKQLLYTGISRAKQNCLIVGSKNDFLNGLKNDYQRVSGLTN